MHTPPACADNIPPISLLQEDNAELVREGALQASEQTQHSITARYAKEVAAVPDDERRRRADQTARKQLPR